MLCEGQAISLSSHLMRVLCTYYRSLYESTYLPEDRDTSINLGKSWCEYKEVYRDAACSSRWYKLAIVSSVNVPEFISDTYVVCSG